MFYRFVQAVIHFAIGLFYRLKVDGRTDFGGPIIFVGNHPNSLIDAAMLFVLSERRITFLAKEPLFRTPVFGWLLSGLGALPVYRKQDAPTRMGGNEGTFETAAEALAEARAITLFPEGKSHSEPQLAEIKTGCARIAFRALAKGARGLRIVPIGLTYSDKHRFRSWVFVDVGQPIEVEKFAPMPEEDEAEAVRALTAAVADGLRQVTLNLEQWEDLRVVETAEQLYSIRLGERPRDPERIRRFAKGLELFRREQPERYQKLRAELSSFRRRLDLVQAAPKDLVLQYRSSEVSRFVLRNAAALLFGFPLFLLGCVVFFVPFMAARMTARVVKVLPDRVATLKLVSALILAPLWWTGLTVVAWLWGGLGWGLFALFAALPLALYTRYFLERRKSALRDIVVFFALGSRARLKSRLLLEGEKLAQEIEALAAEYRPRVVTEVASQA
ncbi:MAG: 1-acyl-sn-glycerol-3-phosphate acyltransferase [Myxococcota bacterium]